VVELFSRGAGSFSGASIASLAMDLFEKKRFLLPIEALIALATNVVVAVLGYYAIILWGL
jgi:hypothetical protein